MDSRSGQDRLETVEKLTRKPLDLLVVGGGIVGSGIARDAAMRGLRVGVVEQHDFAFGTGSRSSRLLHGGLRYLAQGRIGLVREASIEKRIVHGIAPHLSAPLAFVFPTYKCPPWAQWARWKLRIGVRIYVLLCSGRNLGRSSAFSASGLAQYVPGIKTRRLTGAVRYYDGLTNDARLTIDTLRSTANAGGVLLNYCRMGTARKQSDGWHCMIQDRIGNKELGIVANCVINATGPWAEQFQQSSVKLRVTKGIHIVVDRQRLPVPDAVVMTEGPRILFAIPWEERVIVGTTDTDYNGSLEDVRSDSEDVAYVIGVANEAFPEARLNRDDIISHWAGLRPLIADPNGRPSDISRSHEIRQTEPGWIDVAGGKLTTYRLMAEQTVDLVEKCLGRRHTACTTASTPLLEPTETDGISGIAPPPVTRMAVEHYCRREWAEHLDDVMLRRAGWHYYQRESARTAEQVVQWMAEILGWDQARQREEVARYHGRIGLVGQ